MKALDYLDSRIEGGVLNAMLRARMKKLGVSRLIDAINAGKKAGSHDRQLGIIVLSEVNRGQPESKKIILQEV